jgi:hypothetical protein
MPPPQQAAELHKAQIGNYQSEAQQRLDAARRAQQKQQIIQQYGKAAQEGDPDAISQVMSVAPELAGTLTKEPPKGQYDADRGVMIQPDGTFKPIAGLPPKPAPPKPDQFTFTSGTDAQGNPIIVAGNTHTGQVTPTPVGKPAAGSATAGLVSARLATSAGQATDAHKQMSEFEAGVLNGSQKIGTADASLAKMILSGGPLQSSMAERVLNGRNQALARYARSAKTIATAERMLMPRGGSNALMHAEAMLSGAGPGADAQTIAQAHAYRQKLIEGLASHTQNQPQGQPQGQTHPQQPASTGNVDLGKPSIAERVQQLKAQGVSKEQARATLIQEGYDLSGAH